MSALLPVVLAVQAPLHGQLGTSRCACEFRTVARKQWPYAHASRGQQVKKRCACRTLSDKVLQDVFAQVACSGVPCQLQNIMGHANNPNTCCSTMETPRGTTFLCRASPGPSVGSTHILLYVAKVIEEWLAVHHHPWDPLMRRIQTLCSLAYFRLEPVSQVT
jgi:hypothetical protein